MHEDPTQGLDYLSVPLCKQLTSQKMRHAVSMKLHACTNSYVGPCFTFAPSGPNILLTTINELETTLAASRMAAFFFPFLRLSPLTLTNPSMSLLVY